MKNSFNFQAVFGLAALLICLCTAPVAAQQNMTATAAAPTKAKPAKAKKMASKSAMMMIKDWPAMSKMAAETTIKQYGEPTESTPTMLMWCNNGPWMKTIVYKKEIQHDFPKPHKDVLQQVIMYKVPPEMYDELAMYDGSVIIERTKGTLSARCDKEQLNFLALNLAHDIITGKRNVEDARMMYAKTAMGFFKGEKSEYTSGLMFKPEMMGGDPDKPAMMDTKGMEDKKN